MSLHQSELKRQHEAHKARQARLFHSSRVVEVEEKAVGQRAPLPTFRPLWQIVDIAFDWHVKVWHEANDSRVSDLAHENIALRAALRIAGLDLQSAKTDKRPARDIIREVLEAFPGVTWDDLKSQHRTRDIVLPRQICMYEIYTQRKDMSFPQIGRLFGGRDHTTALHAVRKIKAMTAEELSEKIAEQRLYKSRTKRSHRPDPYAEARIAEIMRSLAPRDQ